MPRSNRQEFNTFVRLDEADPELNGAAGLEIYSVAMRAEDPDAALLVLDPLQLLSAQVSDIGRDWACSILRPNAQSAIAKGPRHIVAVFLVMRDERMVSALIYRRAPELDMNIDG